MAKQTLRFDYSRLAEVLQERGWVDGNVLRELLSESTSSGLGFCEALVDAGYVADWDLSRVICEIYQLPFLPVGIVEPDPEALDGIEPDLLRQHALIPLGRFGQVLTISMPGVVPADVLGLIAAETDLVLLPVVGSPKTNRQWVEEHLRPKEPELGGQDWGNMFDDADAAVLMDLESGQPIPAEPSAALPSEPLGEDLLDVDAASLLEFAVPEEDALDEPQPSREAPVKKSSAAGGGASGGGQGVELPPLPEFE